MFTVKDAAKPNEGDRVNHKQSSGSPSFQFQHLCVATPPPASVVFASRSRTKGLEAAAAGAEGAVESEAAARMDNDKQRQADGQRLPTCCGCAFISLGLCHPHAQTYKNEQQRCMVIPGVGAFCAAGGRRWWLRRRDDGACGCENELHFFLRALRQQRHHPLPLHTNTSSRNSMSSRGHLPWSRARSCCCADNLPHKPSAKATSCFSPFSPSRAATALPRISTRPLNSINLFKRFVVSDKL